MSINDPSPINPTGPTPPTPQSSEIKSDSSYTQPNDLSAMHNKVTEMLGNKEGKKLMEGFLMVSMRAVQRACDKALERQKENRKKNQQ